MRLRQEYRDKNAAGANPARTRDAEMKSIRAAGAIGAMVLAGCTGAVQGTQGISAASEGASGVPAAARPRSGRTNPHAGLPQASMVLESGRMSSGQAEVGLERVRIDGQRYVHALANTNGSNLAYDWLFYQDTGDGKQNVLNPRFFEPGQPRFVGVVMRNAAVTDGSRGDFAVRLHGSALLPSWGREKGPILESDGRIRPENLLYRLEAGSLVPIEDSLFRANRSEVCRLSTSSDATVPEFGMTKAVVLVREINNQKK